MEIDHILEPLEADNPAGPDLEYDLEFGELLRAMQGTGEKVTGDHVIEAVPPDWREVKKIAETLSLRTRDLRVAVALTNAYLYLQGYSGLRDGLRLICELSSRFWDTLHPQVDPDDGDATIRCNALLELTDPATFLANLLEAPLVRSKRAGAFGLNAVQVVAGERKPKGDQPPPTKQLLEAAFLDADPDEVQETNEAIGACLNSMGELRELYEDRLGAGNAPDLKIVEELLLVAQKAMKANTSTLVTNMHSEGAADDVDSRTIQAGMVPNQAIRNGADVIRVIEGLCDYYRLNEPSSPVPILLQRAASLVNKSFLEIVGDLSPSGMGEAEKFVTKTAPKSTGISESPQPSKSADDDW